ncbi:MAG: family 1 glycosylhydrolase [Erysipelotrichaceae bacterium]|nr:family 1 glycosylhydrolase [Erysipelotrichaceae bacterium]
MEATAWDWPIDPLGFRITLRTIYDRYELPLMITENGLGSLDVLEDDGLVHDNERIEYLERHIEQMQYALEEGVKILSYNPWSFFDVLSSSNGFAKRYGLVYIDRTETDLRKLKRYKKDSFFWYKRLIQNNGL